MKKLLFLFTLVALVLTLSSISAVVRTVTTDSGWATESASIREGINVTTNNYPVYLQNFTKSATSTATTWLVQYANMTIITSGSFSGNNAILPVELTLSANTAYLLTYDGTDGYTAVYKTEGGNPINLVDGQSTGRICDGENGCYQTAYTGGIITVGWSNSSLSGGSGVNVTLNSPANNSQLSSNPITFNATVTPQTFNVTNASFYVWFSNGTLYNQTSNTITGSGANTTVKNITIGVPGSFLWNVKGVQGNGAGANSSFAGNNYSFSFGIVVIAEEYNTPVLEQSSQTFKINISTSAFTVSTITLNYNNTNYAGTFSQINSTAIQASATLITPSVPADVNKSFFWNITFTNTPTVLTTATRTQQVNNFALDNCSGYTLQILNFTVVNEASQVLLNGVNDNVTVYIDLDLYANATATTPSLEFSGFYNQTNPARVCLSGSLSNSTYFMDTLVSYDADGYAKEFYHIQNYSLNSTTGTSQNITLYDLLDTSSQPFKISYKDSNFLAVKDALIQIQRKYINEGVFKVVELPKTDVNGEVIGHLVLNDVVYSFTVVKGGQILSTFSNVYAICQNPSIQTCTIDLNAFSTSTSTQNFSASTDFLYTLTYDNSTREVSSIFTIPTGTVALVTLNVTTEDALGTSVCSTQATTSAGTLTCVVPSNFGNGTVLAKLYKNGVQVGFGQISLSQTPSQIYGGALIVIAIFIMLTLIGAAMSDNPVFTVIFFMIGVILLMALGLVSHNGFIGGAATVLFLIIAIVLIIIKGGKRS